MQEEEALERAHAEEEAHGRTAGAKLSCRGLYFAACTETVQKTSEVTPKFPSILQRSDAAQELVPD